MKFRSNPAQIKGSIAPLMSPFTADGAVDHAGLTNLVNWQLASGTHGISIGGSTGEPSSQTIAERADAIRTVAAAIDDRVPFMPGTGSAKLDETLELTAAAQDAGIDAALIITPYYARPTQEALYVWYKTVAEEFPDLPIVAYNVPSRTAVDIAPETIARLYRSCDNFVGVKETTKDFEHFSRVLQLCGPDLLVWRTRQPKDSTRLATARPMRPKPTMPTVASCRSRPSMRAGSQVSHSPWRTAPSPSSSRREMPSISARARSAVVSVSTPGVLPTGMPRSVAASRSTLSTPTA